VETETALEGVEHHIALEVGEGHHIALAVDIDLVVESRIVGAGLVGDTVVGDAHTGLGERHKVDAVAVCRIVD